MVYGRRAVTHTRIGGRPSSAGMDALAQAKRLLNRGLDNLRCRWAAWAAHEVVARQPKGEIALRVGETYRAAEALETERVLPCQPSRDQAGTAKPVAQRFSRLVLEHVVHRIGLQRGGDADALLAED